MAPPKVAKRPPKVMEKIEKPISKTKKIKKKSFDNYSIYIYRLLRSLTQDKIGTSKTSMLIMNNFVHDIMEKIAKEAGALMAHSKKNTMGSREIQSAIKLIIPGELAKHANMDGIKAVTMYHNSQEKDK